MSERKVCEAVMPLRPAVSFQAALQIQADILDQGGVLVEKFGDASQGRIELETLASQFEIGEADLGVQDAAHDFFSGRSS